MKRSFDYPKAWRRTRNHDDIVQALRLSEQDVEDDQGMEVDSPSLPTPTSATREDSDVENTSSSSISSTASKEVKRSLLPRAASSTGIPRPVLNAKNS